MIAFLKLIKFPYLILVLIAQLCIRYGFFNPFKPYGVDITLNSFGIFLLLCATTLIGAAGTICIALYKYDTPQLPKSISSKMAYRIFMLFNILGVGIGFYLSNLIGKPIFVTLFILASIGFYLYATYFKEILIINNSIIPILISLSILIVGIFDLLPAVTATNQSIQQVCFSIVFDYTLFTFLLVFLWGIIHDTTSTTKDYTHGIPSIPIVIGQQRSFSMISVFTVLIILAVVYYVYTYLFHHMKSTVLALLGIIAPLLYIAINCWGSNVEKKIVSFQIALSIVAIATSISLLTYQYILL